MIFIMQNFMQVLPTFVNFLLAGGIISIKKSFTLLLGFTQIILSVSLFWSVFADALIQGHQTACRDAPTACRVVPVPHTARCIPD